MAFSPLITIPFYKKLQFHLSSSSCNPLDCLVRCCKRNLRQVEGFNLNYNWGQREHGSIHTCNPQSSVRWSFVHITRRTKLFVGMCETCEYRKIVASNDWKKCALQQKNNSQCCNMNNHMSACQQNKLVAL
jgi:hypothetical protein